MFVSALFENQHQLSLIKQQLTILCSVVNRSHMVGILVLRLGNDNLNWLTVGNGKQYVLRIDLADFNGNTRYAMYNKFIVESWSDNYRLSSLGKYQGTAGKLYNSRSNTCWDEYSQMLYSL